MSVKMNQSNYYFQLWSVIEQVLETDFMISATDEEKLPGNIKPVSVGQKVFLERRPEGDYEDKVRSDSQSPVDKYKPYSPPEGESQASDIRPSPPVPVISPPAELQSR